MSGIYRHRLMHVEAEQFDGENCPEMLRASPVDDWPRRRPDDKGMPYGRLDTVDPEIVIFWPKSYSTMAWKWQPARLEIEARPGYRQVVKAGQWVVRARPGEYQIMDDEIFQRDFEVVVPVGCSYCGDTGVGFDGRDCMFCDRRVKVVDDVED